MMKTNLKSFNTTWSIRDDFFSWLMKKYKKIPHCTKQDCLWKIDPLKVVFSGNSLTVTVSDTSEKSKVAKKFQEINIKWHY